MEEQQFEELSLTDANETRVNGQRIRHTLSLEDRVNAIRAYDANPMYAKVAKQFNCCWEQIRNIVANRNAILKLYAEMQKKRQRTTETFVAPLGPPAPPPPMPAPVTYGENPEDQHNLELLNIYLYEYLKRVHYYRSMPISGDFIRSSAVKFARNLQFATFVPNKVWLFGFLNHYNLTLPIVRMPLKMRPEKRFDLCDIIAFCSKKLREAPERLTLKPVRKLQTNAPANKPVHFSTAFKQEMQRMHRSRAAQSKMIPNDHKRIQEFQLKQRRMIILEKALYEYIQRANGQQQVCLDDEELKRVAGELSAHLQLENFTPTQSWLEHYKSRYDFSVSPKQMPAGVGAGKTLDLASIVAYCREHENTNHTLASLKLQPVRAKKRTYTQTQVSSEIICITDDDEDDADEGDKEKKEQMHAKVQETDVNANNIESFVPECDKPATVVNRPAIKMRSMEQQQSPRVLQNLENTAPQARTITKQQPPSAAFPANEVLLTSYKEALEYMKPLEVFAMLRDNYRAIGLLSQLEQILKDCNIYDNLK